MREQVGLRDRTCAAPYCTRPARHLDLDHLHPWVDHPDGTDPPGGPPDGLPGGSGTTDPPGKRNSQTRSDNLAALCRHHHRAKTLTGWRYEMLTPGVFYWTSPHGLRFLTFAGQTLDLNCQPRLSVNGPRQRRSRSSSTRAAPPKPGGRPSSHKVTDPAPDSAPVRSSRSRRRPASRTPRLGLRAVSTPSRPPPIWATDSSPGKVLRIISTTRTVHNACPKGPSARTGISTTTIAKALLGSIPVSAAPR